MMLHGEHSLVVLPELKYLLKWILAGEISVVAVKL
jgi:hypothetical protein